MIENCIINFSKVMIVNNKKTIVNLINNKIVFVKL